MDRQVKLKPELDDYEDLFKRTEPKVTLLSRNKIRPEQIASFEFVETEENLSHWVQKLNLSNQRLSATRPSNNFKSGSPLLYKTCIVFNVRDWNAPDIT